VSRQKRKANFRPRSYFGGWKAYENYLGGFFSGYSRYKVYLYSLLAAEHDIRGYAEDIEEALNKVRIVEMLNPVARGFRILKIEPKL
jgi:hypothetical protein